MNKTTPLTFIKLGGSVVTFKDQAYQPRRQVLKRLVAEIKAAKQQTGERYLIGHGQGSFAHIPVHQYQLNQGCQNKKSLPGLAKTRQAVSRLNQIVVDEFIKAGLLGVSLLVNQMALVRSKKLIVGDFKIFTQSLDQGLLPITTGDILLDQDQGCSIWSTETVFAQLASYFQQNTHYRPIKQIMVTDVEGVLDKNHQLIPIITPNSSLNHCQLRSSSHIDVTGGMKHKVEVALKQAQDGIPTSIVSGLHPQRLFKVLTHQACPQTLINTVN